jgi:hypothetical protein
MKNSTKLLRLALALTLLVSLSFQSCVEDKCDMTFSYARYSPVYMSQQAFEGAVEVLPATEVENPGKIYVKDNYLFVNEVGKGLHIFDYKTPENPQPLAFINVPGNYDIAINCGKLYLDSSKDLLVFDINNPAQPQLLSRVKNALPHIINYRGFTADPNQGVVVEWKQELVTEPYNCQTGVPAIWQQNQVTEQEVIENAGNLRGINPATAGVAGSMSRFALADEHLYVVSPTQLFVFDGQNCDQPALVNTIDLMQTGEAEMVTTGENLVLVGGTNGVSIFGTDDPSNPQYLSTYEHMTACDPVVMDGDYGYLTLRNGRGERCGQSFTNQLDVIDLSNPAFPVMLNSFGMTNPHGLGIDEDLLFIADGSAGLRIFDASNPVRVGDNPVAHFPEMDGYDVIAFDKTLILVGDDGIALYDYSDPKNIAQLSSIPVAR